MDVKSSLNQCYYRMTISDLRMMNDSGGDNISYNSVLYLDLISYQKNCTISSLAESLHISKPAVTKKINTLVQMGMVTKTRCETDKRIQYLSLGPCAKEMSDLYDNAVARAVCAIEKQYNQEQLASFCAILDTFSAEFAKQE